ncbi:AN1-type zinc finger protein 5-like [Grus japonensis]|uniref:AN1-type zinc finger protein 5-like n=1 Tax=Grus japonensis TaxID=30415 RepID=A0ABC9W585_GRUJA
MEKTMVKQAVALQPMEVDGGADIHLQPMKDPTPEQVEAPEGGCDPVGSLCWSSLFLEVCTPWKGPTLEQLMKNCSLWEGLMLEKLVEDCLLWEGLHAGVGAECEESSP